MSHKKFHNVLNKPQCEKIETKKTANRVHMCEKAPRTIEKCFTKPCKYGKIYNNYALMAVECALKHVETLLKSLLHNKAGHPAIICEVFDLQAPNQAGLS